MRRYWIEFIPAADTRLPMFLARGVGVTAGSSEQALEIVQLKVLGAGTLPPIAKLVEDVDISTLDENHVRPNMGNPVVFGVWFPLGFQRGLAQGCRAVR